MVANIIASLITFISLVAFGNGVVSWLAALIGYEGVTLVVMDGPKFESKWGVLDRSLRISEKFQGGTFLSSWRIFEIPLIFPVKNL